MCNYLSRYVPRLSEVSEPLRRLTEAEATFGWGVEEKSAFEKLKELIRDQQRLAFYDVRKPVVIQCDTSTVGLRAVLMQEGQPVASVSRSLSKSEKNYVAIELECLAIVFACQRFHQYFFGKKVCIENLWRSLCRSQFFQHHGVWKGCCCYYNSIHWKSCSVQESSKC